MSRKKIVAGNWKMNLNYAEAMALTDAIADYVSDEQKTNVILAPPFIYLHDVVSLIQHKSTVFVSAQNCSDKNSGAYTGEIAATMLTTIGVDYVLIGHSERRNYFHEDNLLLAEKMKRVIENSLLPIYCCGETSGERNEGKHFEIVKTQIEDVVFQLDKNQLKEIVIAYEPVWAIGTGVNAAPAQAQEMHRFIRQLIGDKFGSSSGSISILYGGSVTPDNATELFSCADVDGALVGGASLKAKDFIEIINAMEKIVK